MLSTTDGKYLVRVRVRVGPTPNPIQSTTEGKYYLGSTSSKAAPPRSPGRSATLGVGVGLGLGLRLGLGFGFGLGLGLG